MLPKENRLRKNKEFTLVFERGKSVRENLLDLKLIENQQNNSRFGFVVSKNFSKNATLRNKIKRRLRELIRTRMEKIEGGMDVVIIVKRGFQKEDFAKMERDINSLLFKAGMIKP